MQSVGNAENTEQMKKGRLDANMRPVASPVPPRRTSAQPRAGQNAKREGTSSRPTRRVKKATRDLASQRRPGRVTVGGLDISVRLLATFLIVAVITVVLVPTLLQWGDMRREHRAAVADAEATAALEEKLLAQMENWENSEYIAAQARARLGYVDPGETVYAVVDAPTVEGGPRETAVSEDWPPKPWNLRLQEKILETDVPPAVQGAAAVEAVPLSEGEDEQ